ncbi:MAG TPA: hypothetical protein VFE25_09970 [Opitutaceae bacterium]|jgi:hypothetical protein|nr:hypothetical protein [Opitutaceae bacterium]
MQANTLKHRGKKTRRSLMPKERLCHLAALFLVVTAVTSYAQTPSQPGPETIGLSTRADVGSGQNIGIMGLVIGDGPPGEMLIRALGSVPRVSDTSKPLSEPTLTLFDSRERMIATSTGWTNAPQISPAFYWGPELDNPSDLIVAQRKDPAVRPATAKDMAEAGAGALRADSPDSALVALLPPGAYTIKVSGVPSDAEPDVPSTGIALAEIYEMGGRERTRIINMSTRVFVGKGRSVNVSGLVLASSRQHNFLVRAVGPTLGRFDVMGALRHPVLTILDSAGAVVATNTGWGNPVVAGRAISTVSVRPATAMDMDSVGAFRLHDNSFDCALVVTVPSGSVTVKVSGSEGSQGVALAESYPLER